MSNLVPISNGGSLAAAQAAFAENDFTNDVAQKSFNRIGIKGGAFRMYNGKQEIAVSDSRSMEIVVVNAAKAVHREFYEGGYVEGVEAVPVCWSSDGRVPDAKATKRQAGQCETCPKNAKGSGSQGSRACKYSQRIAVVLPGELGGTVYAMKLPAMSIFGESKDGFMPFKPYMTYLAAQKVPAPSVVTEMKFDTSAAVPKLYFRPRQQNAYIGDENIPVIQTQMKSDAAKKAIELSVFVKAGTEAPNVAPAAVAPAPAPAAAPAPMVPAAAASAMSAALGEWQDDN